jgi:hypothetical protein
MLMMIGNVLQHPPKMLERRENLQADVEMPA